MPIAFEGRVGAYEQVDFDLLRCKLGEGFTGWVAQHGEPLLVNDANGDPRGQTIPGTDDVDESMLVVPMRYDGVTVGVITLSKLGLDGFDGDDLRLLAILADQAATAVESARLLPRSQELASELRRLLDMSGELSESLDPRQVANLMAGHLARAMGVDECAISYWDRPSGRLESLGYFPPIAARRDGALLRRVGLPRDRCASWSARRRSSSTRGPERRPGRGRPSCARRQPHPGHAAARRQGPVDRARGAVLEGRRPLDAGAPRPRPHDGQRGGHGPRERAALRGRAQAAPTATR